MRLSRISIIKLVCLSAAARDLSAVSDINNNPNVNVVLVDGDQKPHGWQPKQWDSPINNTALAFHKAAFYESPAERHPNESWRGRGKRRKQHLKEINKY